MKFSAQKNTTTQSFIEIEDIVDTIVLFSGGQACMIIEVIATNFALQSSEDQQVKILSYASLLNSLSFPIQITILSRKLDISSYITLLDKESEQTHNQMLSEHIKLYKNFISELVRVNTVLDKKFYLTISFSVLEKGATGVSNVKDKNALIMDAKNLLYSKSQSVFQELTRIGLQAKVLGRPELIQLFHDIYNPEHEVSIESVNTTVVKGR
jgi:hypothetical protein